MSILLTNIVNEVITVDSCYESIGIVVSLPVPQSIVIIDDYQCHLWTVGLKTSSDAIDAIYESTMIAFVAVVIVNH